MTTTKRRGSTGPARARALALAILLTISVALTGGEYARAATPFIDSVTPSTGLNNESNKLLTIGGGNFDGGASVRLERDDPGFVIDGTGAQTISSSVLTATFDLADAAPGQWRARVTNPDGSTGACEPECFTIVAVGGPTVESTDPSSRGQGAVDEDIEIQGDNFARGAEASFSGTGITVNSTQFGGRTSLVANITIAQDAPTGSRTVTVTNTDDETGTCPCFTVNAGPNPMSSSPDQLGQGATGQNVTINGTTFQSGAQVEFAPATGIQINSTSVNLTGTQMTVNVDVAADAPPDAREITVVNPDGGRRPCTCTLTINGITVDLVTPDTVDQGDNDKVLTITGTNFTDTPSDPTVGFSGDGIDSGAATFVDAQTLEVTIDVAGGATVGPRDVIVTNGDAGRATCSGCLTVRSTPRFAEPTLTVKPISPSSLGQGAQDQTITLQGSQFMDGATVSFSGDDGITPPNPILATFVNSGQLTVTISIAPEAVAGARDVTVTNPDGGSVTATGGFAVATGPRPTGVSPAAVPNTGSHTLTITGTQFDDGRSLAVQLERAGQQPISGQIQRGLSSNPPTSTDFRATFNLTGAAPGSWTPRVTHDDDEGTGVCTCTLTIGGASPTVTGVAPDNLGRGASEEVVITGSSFTKGAQADFGDGVAATTEFVDPNELNALVTVAGDAAPGPRDVRVTNSDGAFATCAGCFAVNGNPTITDVDPSSRGRGATNQDIVITGTSFAPDAEATFSGAGIVKHSQTVDPPTQITVNISVSPTAPAERSDVTVDNKDGGEPATCTGCFGVNASPAVTGVEPNAVGQGAQDRTLVVNGSNFVDTATVSFSGSGITINGTPEITSNAITVNVSVAQGAATGPRNVTVDNNDAGVASDATCTGCLTVNAAPAISGLSPAARPQGTSNQDVEINGTGFQPGADVVFSGEGITENADPTVTATTITVNISIAGSAPTGGRDVTVTNPDGGSVTSAEAFSVTAAPTVTAVNPNALSQGAGNETVVVTGTGFQDGAQVGFSGSGVTVNETTVDSPTQITASVSVDDTAATGLRNVTVTNDDTGTATCTGCFSVVSAVAVSEVVPGDRGQGAQNQVLTITGSGFAAGATVAFSGTGVTVDGTPTVDDPSQITVTVDVAPTATPGTRDVTVTNTDGGTGTCPDCFTVNTKPGVTSLTPSSAVQGASDVTVVIAGSGFAAGATVAFSGTGVTVDGTPTVDSPSQITVTVDVAPTATPGTRDVTITNTDGGTGTCPGCFTVNATAPTVASLSPSSLGQGAADHDVVITGAGFTNGATVSFSGSGITAGTTTVDSPTQITVKVSVALDAAAGARGVTVSNPGELSGACSGCFTVTGAEGRFSALKPARILDTRTSNGGFNGQKVGPEQKIDVQITGRGGVPGSGVTAVALNVTATEPTAGGYLTVWPAGATRPVTSNLNFVAGQSVPNLVVVKLGSDGKVSVFNSHGSTHVIFDVAGSYGAVKAGNDGRFQALVPARIADTRTNVGGFNGQKVGPEGKIDVQVTGRGGVPATGVDAVALNVTVTQPTAASFLTVWPAGADRPVVSNLNFVPGQTVPNRVLVKLGEGGKVSIFNPAGSVHVVVDVNGWFTDSSVSTGDAGTLIGLVPKRIVDTRTSVGGFNQKVGPGQKVDFQVTGVAGGAPTGASAVILNVTTTGPTAPSFLTLWPSGQSQPLASDLNFVAGETVPNLVIVKVGTDGEVSVFNAEGSTHVIFDVVGYVPGT